MTTFKRTSKNVLKNLWLLLIVMLFQVACSSNDNTHTTVTTVVPPPPRQVLTVVPMPTPAIESAGSPAPANSASTEQHIGVDLSKPLLVFNLANEKTFRVGEVVPIEFSVRNVKLRNEGGEYRIRYIIDDEDPQWVESPQAFGLSGWVPEKHTIRLELIGPDGWPYRNGNQNIVTREITVVAQ